MVACFDLNRERVFAAGLGEKKVSLNLAFGPLEVDQKLKKAFPKPEDSGGYSLLGTPERGCRNLTPIEGLYSVEILKGSIGQGKVFIRPLQNDLKLTVDPVVNRSVSDTSSLFTYIFIRDVNISHIEGPYIQLL